MTIHNNTANCGCCHDEVFVVSVSKDMELSSKIVNQFQQVCIAVIVFVAHFKFLEDASTAKTFTSCYPPPLMRMFQS